MIKIGVMTVDVIKYMLCRNFYIVLSQIRHIW